MDAKVKIKNKQQIEEQKQASETRSSIKPTKAWVSTTENMDSAITSQHPKLSKTAIVIDSSFLFPDFIQHYSHLFTHLIPINAIRNSDGKQIPIIDDLINTKYLRQLISAKKGDFFNTSQPSIGQIIKVINSIEDSSPSYQDVYIICVNQKGSSYYETIVQYLTAQKECLTCRYWIFNLNTIFYSAVWLLKRLNDWIKQGLAPDVIFKKLRSQNYKETLIGMPLSTRYIVRSGRFAGNRRIRSLLSLTHLKLLIFISFSLVGYQTKFWKACISTEGAAKSIGRYLRRRKQFKYLVVYHCDEDDNFTKNKLKIIKKLSRNQNLKIYHTEMPSCCFALFNRNYMFGFYERKMLKLSFLKYARITIKTKKSRLIKKSLLKKKIRR